MFFFLLLLSLREIGLFVVCLFGAALGNNKNTCKGFIKDIPPSLFKAFLMYLPVSNFTHSFFTPSKNPFQDHPHAKQHSFTLLCFNIIPATCHYLTLLTLKFIFLIIYSSLESKLHVTENVFSHVHHRIPCTYYRRVPAAV